MTQGNSACFKCDVAAMYKNAEMLCGDLQDWVWSLMLRAEGEALLQAYIYRVIKTFTNLATQ